MSILEVSNVSKSFGGVKANVDISMNVEKGKIVGFKFCGIISKKKAKSWRFIFWSTKITGACYGINE